jgi:hypothetical protein
MSHNMLEANRRLSKDQSISLQEIMTGGLTPAFQSIHPWGRGCLFGRRCRARSRWKRT